MSSRFPLLTLFLAVVGTAACSSAPAGPIPVADLPDIDTAAALGHMQRLASDEFEGRAPGSPGEALTVSYLVDQFTALGLEPGNPDGTYVQQVPLVGITPSGYSPLTVTHGGRAHRFAHGTDVIAYSQRVTETIDLSGSDVVFAGYGVQAPEFQWDDFKGLDVAGKTLIVLVNDPPVTGAGGELDPATFGGPAMTYYGRWTYKYEKAAELGAAAVLIVHDTPTAGYGWNVVQGFSGQRFDLVTPDQNMGRAAIQGWLSAEATTRLFQAAGLDFADLKARAATRDFTPVPLGATAAMSFTQTMRMLDSQNVVARLPGSDPVLRDEYVVYTAHWDHFGIGPEVNGDTIYNGAVDNATGTAALLVMAAAMRSLDPAPKRSALFLAVTAEEQGLLGSEYYARFPLYPLEKTVANINVDANLPLWGRTRDVIVIGLGASDLDDYLRDAAAEQGRTLSPDAEPEKGFYYRSDHFNFAKVGVPALNTDDGILYVDQPEGFGRQKKDEYTASRYHAPSDEIDPAWDLSGYAEQLKLLMAVGVRVANADRFPEWKPGNEFKAMRDKMLGR
ncbi:MAG TPA: M28 family peptidase [Vicinamibacterales bacterium]|nr:M28 family peptidase [Vicinamibacterales bacterium]